MRIGNIAYRKQAYVRDNQEYYIDIIKWCPNEYLNHKNEYELVETQLGETKYKHKEHNYYISKDMFEIPEFCYTLATIDIKEEPDIILCGLRPFELQGEDRANFEEIVKQAYQYAIDLYNREHGIYEIEF